MERPKPETEMITMVERKPSVNIAPYPIGRPCFSFSICLEVVPDPTRAWKPEREPQAMIKGITGQKGDGCPPDTIGEKEVNAGAVKPAKLKIAAIPPIARPMYNNQEFR